MGSRYTIKALDESTWQAFASLVERNNGIFGGCWCMGFHADDSREPDLNRERKLARVRARAAHAALVFDKDRAGHRTRNRLEPEPVRETVG